MRTIQNDTGLELGYFWCQSEPGDHRLIFLLKGTFAVVAGESATMVAREARDAASSSS